MVNFRNIYLTTKTTKLRSFQYRLLLSKIYCNDILYKWKLVSSESCEYCKADNQTTQHLLCQCKFAKNIWDWVALELKEVECLTWNNYIFCNLVHPKPRHIVNKIVLITKYFIYCNKCLGKQFSKNQLVSEICMTYKVEQHNGFLCKNKVKEHWQLIKDTQLLFSS